jgi:MFS family permease
VTQARAPARLKDLPRGVWVLGFVSMFMDISSEMIHALLPLYLVTVLGASTLIVGVIEGFAEAAAMIVKIFSGAFSDWLGKRKILAATGYGLAAATKPLFPLATGIGLIVAARLIDRIGKGIRDAPRDALVADLTHGHVRGGAYGLRQALDTVGAVVGPLAAMALMLWTANSYTTVFWAAVVPAFVAFALIAFFVHEPARAKAAAAPRWRLRGALQLPPAFWIVVAVAIVLTLARFSEAFLVLRAQNVGMPIALVPLVMVAMNVFYALSAYPAGAASDQFGRRRILVAGIAMLIVADIILAAADGVPLAMLAVAFWGLHMGLTQGLLAALVADNVPEHLRGTAFGVFNCAAGVALLAASVIAGGLWDVIGPAATFTAGAAFSALALIGIALLSDRHVEPHRA